MLPTWNVRIDGAVCDPALARIEALRPDLPTALALEDHFCLNFRSDGTRAWEQEGLSIRRSDERRWELEGTVRYLPTDELYLLRRRACDLMACSRMHTDLAGGYGNGEEFLTSLGDGTVSAIRFPGNGSVRAAVMRPDEEGIGLEVVDGTLHEGVLEV